MREYGMRKQEHLDLLSTVKKNTIKWLFAQKRKTQKKENSIIKLTNRKELLHMEEKVLALLSEEFPEIDFTSSDTLVDDGILDSLTITGIISTLSMEFNITIPYEEIVEENFNSISGLASMVERLQAEQS
jgi:acyl carrier protein